MRIPANAWRLANRIASASGRTRALQPELCALARRRAIESITVPGHPSSIPRIESAGESWGEVLGWRRFDVTPIPEIVAGWMDSPTHRAILVDRSYPVIGTAIYRTGDNWYFCALVTTGLI